MTELLKFVRLIVVLVPMVSGRHSTIDERPGRPLIKNVHLLSVDPQKGRELCARLSKVPYFGIEMLLGKAWRIYYSWNMDLQNECVDLTFRNATPAIIKRFYKKMNEYLEDWPYWNAAAVLVRMGRLGHEMLLFADEAPGTFEAMPNVIAESISPLKQLVPLLKFHLKLMYGGKYLLMADCQVGVSTLSSRRNKLPYRAEINGIVSTLDLGPGSNACLADKNEEP